MVFHQPFTQASVREVILTLSAVPSGGAMINPEGLSTVPDVLLSSFKNYDCFLLP